MSKLIKHSACLFINNIRGIEVLKKLKNKLIIEEVILSKKFLNPKTENFLIKNKIKFSKINKINTLKVSNLIKKTNLQIICGFPYIFPKKIIEISKYGIINCHAGPLPDYRGGSPLNWQLINGEKQIGISIIKISEKIDDGKILVEHKFLNKKYNINQLHKIVNKKFSNLIFIAIKNLINKKYIKKNYKGKYWPQRKESDSEIYPFKLKANQIYNYLKALQHPYPNPFFYYQKKKIIIYKIVGVYKKNFLKKNYFLKIGKFFYIKCKDKVIKFL